MKRLLMICAMLVTMVVTAFAQKTIDYTTYDVMAKAGDVSIIVKDNDYRMVIGSLKKPKLSMVMGYTSEQAASKIDRILDFSKESYTKKNRNVQFAVLCSCLTLQVRVTVRSIILLQKTKMQV